MQPKVFLKLMAFLFVVSLLVSGASPQAIGQATGGTLRGIVKDSTGAVIPDAVITATNEATGAKFKRSPAAQDCIPFPTCWSEAIPFRSSTPDLKSLSARTSRYLPIRSLMRTLL